VFVAICGSGSEPDDLAAGMLLALVVLAAIVLLTVVVSIIMARASNHSALTSGILGGVLAPVILAVILLMAVIVTRVQMPFPSAIRPDKADTPRDATIDVDVLVLNFDPVMPQRGGRSLRDSLGWRDPRKLADDYAADVERATAGQVRFRIVEWRDVDAFPIKEDGFRYTPEAYQQHFERGSGWHQPDAVDYRRILEDQRVVPLVDASTVDEVWLFGGPYFGYSEAAMAGPGAFDVNGRVLDRVVATRPFVVMGFNYERGVAEMLENLCHRVEATMSRVYGGWEVERLNHDWARFAANEAQSGTAAVGTCHWPPNAEREYDFNNPRVVSSTAPYWRDYPSGPTRQEPVSRETWGGPDYARRYFHWWFAHLPRAAGKSADGHLQNWWKYVFF
jgi:hypothetical protein